jgi:hypothetical protein
LVALVLITGLVIVRGWFERLAIADPERHESICALWNTMFRGKAVRSQEVPR